MRYKMLINYLFLLKHITERNQHKLVGAVLTSDIGCIVELRGRDLDKQILLETVASVLCDNTECILILYV